MTGVGIATAVFGPCVWCGVWLSGIGVNLYTG